nr:response regulator [Pseudomonadota bacterium]
MTNKLIIIVEDETAIAEVVEFSLKQENFSTIICSTGEAALKALAQNKADLLLIDLGLPDINGFDLAKKIKSNFQIPFIFLTSRAEEVDKILGFEIGADDYITKPFSPRELTARVKALLKRLSTSEQDSKITAYGNIKINEDKLAVEYQNQPLTLTRYEYKILLLLIKTPGKVFSRENIMLSVWEDPNMSLDRTIDTHIKTLRQKFKSINENDEVII